VRSDLPEQELAARLRKLCGPGLRSVIYLHEDGKEVLYLRDDVQSTDEHLVHAFETLLFDMIGSEFNEGSYGHGELLAVTRRFEEAVELHFPIADTRGVALAVDGPTLEGYDDNVIPTLHETIQETIQETV